MNMSDTLNHLGPIFNHSEPLEVHYSPNQFLGWVFFYVSYSKLVLVRSDSKFDSRFDGDGRMGKPGKPSSI